MKLFLTTCVAFLAFLATACTQSPRANLDVSPTRSYYVAANGDDSRSGLSPQTAWKTIERVTGYQLRPGSPCMGKGMLIPNHGPRDFFGNPLKNDAVSFGVFEPPAPSNASHVSR